MLSTPLDKISVQDIVKTCELNRKTFYYHFRDKQALVSWIFDSEFANLTDLNHDDSIIDELLGHLHVNKDFYVAALMSDVQNNLCDHLFKVVYDGIMYKIVTVLGTRKMTLNDIKIIANYFSNALIGCISQWARAGMKTSVNENNINFHTITQQCLEFLIYKLIEENK